MTSADIAELREFISGELQEAHTRLDRVDGRLDQVYAGQLDFQEYVTGHFGKVYTRLDDGSSRLSRVETQFDEMRSDFRAFGEELRSTNRKTEELRSDMNRGFLDLREEIVGVFRSRGERLVELDDPVGGEESKPV